MAKELENILRQFAVIGLGRFGMSLAETLSELGNEVLAVDKNEKRVYQANEYTTNAVQADATDSEALEQLGLENFDVVIVSLAENMQASILITIMLKERGVRNLVSKAINDVHGRILAKIGADKVVFPERDMGEKLAHNLSAENVLDHIDLSSGYSLTEVEVPAHYSGKTLREIGFGRKKKLSVVLLKKSDRVMCEPDLETAVREGDVMVLVGRDDALRRFEVEQERKRM